MQSSRSTALEAPLIVVASEAESASSTPSTVIRGPRRTVHCAYTRWIGIRPYRRWNIWGAFFSWEAADIWADSHAPVTKELASQVQGTFEPMRVRDDLLQCYRAQYGYMRLSDSLVYTFGALVGFVVGLVGLTLPSSATQVVVLSIISLASGVITGLVNRVNMGAKARKDSAAKMLDHLYSVFPELDESHPNFLNGQLANVSPGAPSCSATEPRHREDSLTRTY